MDAGDASPGDGVCATAAAECTVRAAVEESNAFAGHERVDVPAGVYAFAPLELTFNA